MSAIDRLLIGCILATAVLVAGVLGLRHYGAERYAVGYSAAVEARAKADAKAVAARTERNAAEALRQAVSNATITEKKHEEIQPVRERIVTQHVYVGTAVCGDRSAGSAETEGDAGSNSADPPRRLVREDADRDIRALKLAVEEDLATGRACQATLRENGMMP